MLTKEDILEEIRKTAKENGGVPLGSKRFEDKTGIGRTDWGRYWARFGDVQREAGFKANTLQGAYDDAYLFERYVVFTRELGKFPVRGELIVKRYDEPDFPTHNAFFRLGTKQQFLSKLLKYSEEKGYDDIIKLCNDALEKEIEEESQNNASKEEIGSVYLVRSGSYYKIGRTNDMDRRHHEITIILPEGLKLIHEIKTDDPSGIEAYWHKRFEAKQKNGEWFDLNASDVKAFKRWRRIV